MNIFKRAKQGIGILLLCMTALCMCVSCTQGAAQSNGSKSDKNISIVTTTYAAYDWVKSILGENPSGIKLTYLLDKGVDIHSYQASAEDIIKISNADMFIYSGGQSDAWIDSVLRNAHNTQQKKIVLTALLGEGALEEEVVEGMQGDAHTHEHKEEGPHDHENASLDSASEHEKDKAEIDEHVWLSLKNAAHYVKLLAGELGDLDPEQKSLYEKNSQAYIERLKDLDTRFQRMVSQSHQKTILVADRFPFRYLTHDYGVNYYAAFSGCYADAEASFDTIAFLAKKVDEIPLHSIVVLEGSNEKIAHAIINATHDQNQKVVILDSLQSVSADDIDAGKDYYNTMERNLSCLQEALS